jgi:hypothetical protein
LLKNFSKKSGKRRLPVMPFSEVFQDHFYILWPPGKPGTGWDLKPSPGRKMVVGKA